MRERGRGVSFFFFSLSKKAPVRSKVRRWFFVCLFLFPSPTKEKICQTFLGPRLFSKRKEGQKKNKDGKEKRQTQTTKQKTNKTKKA